MMVPRTQLIKWFALIVIPFSIIAVTSMLGAAVSGIMITAFFVFAALDAFRAYGTIDHIKIEVQDLIRLTKDRQGSIEVIIKNNKKKSQWIRLGLDLPREIYSSQEDVSVVLPDTNEWSRFQYSCTPWKRGKYILNQCYLEGTSPMGFWAVRNSQKLKSEIRVYPNLMQDRKYLAFLFLNRGSYGVHAQRQVGKGREFEKLREYIPGDSYNDIHWKATAKRGRPISKEFQIERTQEVYVIIDASRLSARNVTTVDAAELPSETIPQSGITILERFVTSALIMGLAAEKQDDLFGILTFSDKVSSFVRAKNGKSHYGVCRDVLYTLQPEVVTPDFDELCTFIRLRLRKRALLVFLTNLDDPVLADSFLNNMEMISQHHLILVNMLQPIGTHPLFSKMEISSVKDVYHELSGHILWSKLREIEKILKRHGINFSLLKNEKMAAQLVSQYINIKRRQLL
ncbi:MAG: hypothetical protein A2161_19765 [Candidatus Schekmanbacteria bacterium RBG_13_48_7]|uniref:DUF58 domain-containing protein n=1 Tax=Candidatus Schekmanbacteria bacterium RBG_13_48_7 TaxID=1817878 RepID=A0A1F7S1I1_9BACT|nr:MAG: hypothetical protein A2161_19765 [Candidatus Schekmanbacteria bacterium RBG_13_48_7]